MKLMKFSVFESVDPFSFKSGDDFHYYFNDDFGNEFMVEFDKIDKDSVEIVYLVKDKITLKWSYKEVKTNIYKVTQTLLGEILPHFLERNSWVNEVLIKGLSKENESDFISKRTRWYFRFLTNNPIKGWVLDRSGNEIYLFKN
jgi:hypothetical protein